MARKVSASKQGGVVVVSAPAPARRRFSPRRVLRRGYVRARRAGASVSGAYSRTSIRKQMGGIAVGGFAVGLIEKTFPNLPTLPLVGRKGAIALAIWFMQPKEPILQDIGKAAAAMAGYELGKTGSISGMYDDSHVFTST